VANPSIRRIEQLNYLIGGIVILLAALTQPRDRALGVAVGVALTCVNFFVLRRLIAKWTAEAAVGKTGHSAILMLPKMLLLMGAVVGALALLPIDAIAFTAGYSIFILSIVVETTHAALRGNPAPDAKDTETHG
jgi:hypothetical protein